MNVWTLVALSLLLTSCATNRAQWFQVCEVPELECDSNRCCWEYAIRAKQALEQCNARISAQR